MAESDMDVAEEGAVVLVELTVAPPEDAGRHVDSNVKVVLTRVGK